MKAPAAYNGALAMSDDEKHYFSERAAIERQRAEESTNPHVVEIHKKLADIYERLVETDDGQAPRMNGDDSTASFQA